MTVGARERTRWPSWVEVGSTWARIGSPDEGCFPASTCPIRLDFSAWPYRPSALHGSLQRLRRCACPPPPSLRSRSLIFCFASASHAAFLSSLTRVNEHTSSRATALHVADPQELKTTSTAELVNRAFETIPRELPEEGLGVEGTYIKSCSAPAVRRAVVEPLQHELGLDTPLPPRAAG
jgi:hypothetical protein